jgi:inorganic pyrophosphatase
MADYDALFDWGKDGEFVYHVNEIAKNSMLKVEYDRANKVFVLDRVEPGIFAKPCNYGFIPRTLDEDGDALDTLMLMDEPLTTGVVVKCRVVGVMNFEDGGEMDHKVVVVPDDDRHWGNDIKDIDDVSDTWKNQVEYHFNHYKDLKKPGTTEVLGWGKTTDAWKIIHECAKRYAQA